MTQKRFKKLLMSKGYGRNFVNATVKTTIQRGMPYAEAIKYYNLIISISCVAESFTNAVINLQKVAESASKAIGVLGERYKESLKGDDANG